MCRLLLAFGLFPFDSCLRFCNAPLWGGAGGATFGNCLRGFVEVFGKFWGSFWQVMVKFWGVLFGILDVFKAVFGRFVEAKARKNFVCKTF